MASLTNRFGRRTIVLLWLVAISIVIGVLIAIEQIPILYLLATLALVVLLLIVAYSDLESVGRDGQGTAG